MGAQYLISCSSLPLPRVRKHGRPLVDLFLARVQESRFDPFPPSPRRREREYFVSGPLHRVVRRCQ